MFGDPVLRMHPGLIKYFQEIEAADAARRAAAPTDGQQAGPPDPTAPPAIAPSRRRYASLMPWEEDMDPDDFGV